MSYIGWWTVPLWRGRRGRRVARGPLLASGRQPAPAGSWRWPRPWVRSLALPFVRRDLGGRTGVVRAASCPLCRVPTRRRPDRPPRAPTSSSVSAAGSPSSSPRVLIKQLVTESPCRSLTQPHAHTHPPPPPAVADNNCANWPSRRRASAPSRRLERAAPPGASGGCQSTLPLRTLTRGGLRTGGRVTTCRASGRFAGEKCGLVTFYAVGER